MLDAARELGVDLDSVCGGRGICGRCQVVPTHGSFAKFAIEAEEANLSPRGAVEDAYKGRRKLGDHGRLGCAAHLHGDMVIDVPPESQLHRQVIDKDLDLGEVVLDPRFTLHYVERDGRTLAEALQQDWQLDVAVPASVAAKDAITVAVREGKDLITAWPGYVDRGVGVAVDIGSTTVAGHLLDLSTGEVLASSGRMNPQIRFGEDLMSRVSYVMMNPGGDVELTRVVREALDELMGELLETAALGRDAVLEVVLVGNPVMHHIVLGFDPTPLGQAPFPLATDGPVERPAEALDLDLPNASVYVAPCIAGHVGADTAAAILAEGPHRSDALQLLVDVGTNAEIVLGNNQRMFAASSPTGPAFEGAQISCGQRASAGAIEKVRIDDTTLEPRFRVIGSTLWSDEDGFAESVASTGITGVCGSGIIEVISELVRVGVIDQAGVIAESMQARTARVVADERTFAYVLHEDLHITQADIRAIQLAKAALRAGIELLLEHAEVTTVDDVRIAGAFGAHIDPPHAIMLGLIPPVDPHVVRSVGNSAGTGAARMLLSMAQRHEMEQTVDEVTKIETAIEPRFQEHFVEALGFAFSPTPSARESRQSGGRRRRKRSQ